MRILVCGGRNFYDWRLLEETLDNAYSERTLELEYLDCIIEGGAAGADSLARQYAIYNEITYQEYPADWKMYGKVAGMYRNSQMLVKGNPDLVIAFPGGKGTANMIQIAKEAGIEVREIKE